MNQNFGDLTKIINSIDVETIEKLVAISGVKKAVDATSYSTCARYLQGMYLAIVHADQHPTTNLRRTINRDLASLSKSLGKVRSSLSQDTMPNVLDALEASSLDLNFQRAAEAQPPVQFKTTIEELRAGMTTLAGLIKHFFDRQDAFDKTKRSFLITEILLKDERTRIADVSLNLYFRKPPDANAATIIVRTIGTIYNRLFKTSFSVTTKWQGTARYGGPAIEFACAAINELQLNSYFNASSQTDLINKIGDAWKNDKRRKRAAPPSRPKTSIAGRK